MFKTKIASVWLLAAPVLLTVPVVGSAETLAASAFGGNNQGQAVCYLYNAGPGSVSITSKGFTRETGGFPPASGIVYDTCTTSLAVNTLCAFVVTLPSNGGTACRVVISPSAANVRGTLEIRDAGNNAILNSVPLK